MNLIFFSSLNFIFLLAVAWDIQIWTRLHFQSFKPRPFKQTFCPSKVHFLIVLFKNRCVFKKNWEVYVLVRPSLSGTFHILIGKFSYFVIRFLNHIFFVINFSYVVIRFLLNSSIVKSDNEIGKVNDKKNLI